MAGASALSFRRLLPGQDRSYGLLQELLVSLEEAGVDEPDDAVPVDEHAGRMAFQAVAGAGLLLRVEDDRVGDPVLLEEGADLGERWVHLRHAHQPKPRPVVGPV